MKFCAIVIAAFAVALPRASADSRTPAALPTSDAQRRQTAVALNYCRAALHRIRRCPSKRVLLEERERILNNLSLSAVADAEVVKLYTALLSEICDIKIADKEQGIIRGRHKREFRRRVAAHITSFSLQMATGEYTKALKTGAASWWDYRTMVWNRELDLWSIERSRLKTIDAKSTLFLDTFWKMARKRSIPDKWLVRADDLDKLDAARRETDPTTRLRVLKRMQPFLECYPPYWYYVARTEQSLGQLFAAAKTFERLERTGRGHFRKDELLAAGVANWAAIQDYLRQPSAAKTAQRALAYSGNSWQVNLTCAAVLNHRRRYQAAEDALLRNLDVELETSRSLTALLALYCDRKQTAKITARLRDPGTVKRAAVPTLLRCALLLGDSPVAKSVKRQVAASISIDFDCRFGPDDVVVRVQENWYEPAARVSLSGKKLKGRQPVSAQKKDGIELRFKRVADVGSVLQPVAAPPTLQLAIAYPDGSTLRVHFQTTRQAMKGGSLSRATASGSRRSGYAVTAIDVGKTRIAFGE